MSVLSGKTLRRSSWSQVGAFRKGNEKLQREKSHSVAKRKGKLRHTNITQFRAWGVEKGDLAAHIKEREKNGYLITKAQLMGKRGKNQCER